METHYPDDKALIDGMSKEEQFVFGTWIFQLETVMREYGKKHLDGDAPYDLPLRKGTGLKCWHDMYADGMTPRQAFDEDRENWD